MYQLTEIKRLRKKLGINQKELALQAGVSQSLIAKIESNKIEPTYSKACRIIETLRSLEEQEEVKAQQLMHKKVVFVRPKDKVKQVIKIMKQKGISQIPVMKNKVVCGLINEKIILENIADNVGGKTVEDIMVDCPPIVSLETSQKSILELIRENQLILVAEKGEIKGLITKSDLLGRI